MNNFENFYSNFLAYRNAKTYNPCVRRSEVFSFYWKIPLMVTDYYDSLKYSIDPFLLDSFKSFMEDNQFDKINDDLKLEIDEWFSTYSWNYMVNIYLRYSLDSLNSKITSCQNIARLMNEKDEDLVLKNIKSRSNGYKKAVWENYYLPLINKEHLFIVEKDGEKVSQATITNIDNGGANIMVVTDSKYQKKGYGKAAVAKAVSWCLSNDILPCYFHDESNTASQKLALSLGFELQCKECDLFIHKNEKY